jgi:aryl-alcohol dehydrogenase
MRVRAAVVPFAGADFVIDELELDEPRDDEVLVRLVATGVCHTDLAARAGHMPVPYPIVLGHEGAGIVERVGGQVTDVVPGDHVVVGPAYCGACSQCRRGAVAYCLDRFRQRFSGARPDGSATLTRGGQTVHGSFFGQSSFGTHAVVGSRTLVVVPREVPLELLGPLACGVGTGAGAVLNRLRPEPGDSFAVFGSGAVGMSGLLAAVVAGCTPIIAVDVQPSRLQEALALGATHVVDSRRAEPVAEIRRITGDGVDVVLDTTGRPDVLAAAMESLAVRGSCVAVGLAAPGAAVAVGLSDLVAGRSLSGVLLGDAVPRVFVPRLIELYLAGRFPFDRLCKIFPLAEINEAVAAATDGSVVKPVLRMG